MDRGYNVGLGARGGAEQTQKLCTVCIRLPLGGGQAKLALLIGAFRTTSNLHLDVFAANNVTKKTSETWSSSQYYKEHKVKLTRCKKDQ